METAALGAMIATPLAERTLSNAGALGTGDIVILPLKLIELVTLVGEVPVSITMKPWSLKSPLKMTWLGDSTYMIPCTVSLALKRGLVPALMMMFFCILAPAVYALVAYCL